MSVLRGVIYGASYDGCNGWSQWTIREIRFRCRADRAEAAKKRAERRISATAGTYSRRGIEWRSLP